MNSTFTSHSLDAAAGIVDKEKKQSNFSLLKGSWKILDRNVFRSWISYYITLHKVSNYYCHATS